VTATPAERLRFSTSAIGTVLVPPHPVGMGVMTEPGGSHQAGSKTFSVHIDGFDMLP
jgi:hypothetical protein